MNSRKPFPWLGVVLAAVTAPALAFALPTFTAGQPLKSTDLAQLTSAITTLQNQVSALQNQANTLLGTPVIVGDMGIASTSVTADGGAGFLVLAPGGSGVGAVTFQVFRGTANATTGERVSAGTGAAQTNVVFMPANEVVTITAVGVNTTSPTITFYWYPFGPQSKQKPSVSPAINPN